MSFNVSKTTQNLIDMILNNHEIREAFITFFEENKTEPLLAALEEQIKQPQLRNDIRRILEAEIKTKTVTKKQRDSDNNIYEKNLNLNSFNHGTRKTESTD